MTQFIQNFCHRVKSWFTREDGVASIEFVALVPITTLLFMVTGETSMLSMRKANLDRALEMTIRELRLGMIPNPTQSELRTRVCKQLGSPTDCTTNLTLELHVRQAKNATMSVPSLTSICTNTTTKADPVLVFEPGVANDLVLVRACYVVSVYFSTSTGGMTVAQSMGKEFQIVATSAYVNEPK